MNPKLWKKKTRNIFTSWNNNNIKKYSGHSKTSLGIWLMNWWCFYNDNIFTTNIMLLEMYKMYLKWRNNFHKPKYFFSLDEICCFSWNLDVSWRIWQIFKILRTATKITTEAKSILIPQYLLAVKKGFYFLSFLMCFIPPRIV